MSLEFFKKKRELQPEVADNLRQQVEKAKEKLPTEILLERLRNPKIQEQILQVFSKYRTSFANQPEEALRLVNERIEKEFSSTGIAQKSLWNFFFAGSFNRLTGETTIKVGDEVKPEDKEADMLFKAITEAHEKEHSIRSAVIPLLVGVESRLNREVKQALSKKSLLAGKAWNVLTFNALVFPMRMIGLIDPTMMALLLATKAFNTPYLHSTFEVYARMSQLKNYFGFEGDEVFTEDHLQYAKENYIKDNKMEKQDGMMGDFLKNITPKTQKKFLEIINSHGI